MATGVIGGGSFKSPAPLYFPMILHSSPSKPGADEVEDETDNKEDEEEDEEVGSEEEEECLELAGLPSSDGTLDVTKQLLRFADVISLDVQRYFGRRTGDPDACHIYSDTVSVATSGRLRYYDDLLKIARTGNLGEQESGSLASQGAAGGGGLGPLAELFHHTGHSHGRGQPMSKRHLPLSFWSEPVACCPPLTLGTIPDSTETLSHGSPHASPDTHVRYDTHVQENVHPDFSDLLANWDTNPEIAPSLTEHTYAHLSAIDRTHLPNPWL